MTPINTNSFSLHQANRASHAPVGSTRGFEYEDEDGDHEAEASLQIEGQAPATASGARSASLMLYTLEATCLHVQNRRCLFNLLSRSDSLVDRTLGGRLENV